MTSAAELIAQKAALEEQQVAMIQALLETRDLLDADYETTKARIGADLKALGWHRTRESKASKRKESKS